MEHASRATSALLLGVLLLACRTPSTNPVEATLASRPPGPTTSATTTLSRPPGIAIEPGGVTQAAEVVDVIDGDTVEVLIDGRRETVRFIGIDTPELRTDSGVPERMAEEAADANAELVEGETVHLERDKSETDRFGRLLRYAWLRTDQGWLMVNRELVRSGLAEARTYRPDTRWQDVLDDAEDDARDDGLGIWAALSRTGGP